MSSLPIAAVSLETGIAKEVLRKWEKRYGFPSPDRDDNGNRLYGDDQVARLHLISQLIDGGMRPGVVVSLEMDALQTLLATKAPPNYPSANITHGKLVGWLQLREPEQLRHQLQSEMQRTGLTVFITDTLPAMNQMVGIAWQQGEISVLDEHIYSETLQDLLRSIFVGINKPDGAPRILFTTPVGELHTLGILMLQVYLSMQGGCCISLGAQTPAEEIALAVQQLRIEILCLSISSCFPQRKVISLLKKIRSLLPERTAFWVGGAGVTDLKACPRGVKVLSDFAGVEVELTKFLKLAKSAQDAAVNSVEENPI